jgi:hypothetical protein
MKKHLATAIGAVLIVASLAACSSGSTVSPSTTATASSGSSAAAQRNNRTYTKADLARILGLVNSRLKLGGSVEVKDGADTEAVDALDSFLASGQVTVTPASCLKLITSDEQLVSDLGSRPVIAGILSSSRLNLIATTVPAGGLPSSLSSNFASRQSAILSSCKHLTIVATDGGKTASVAVDFTPLAVRTSASQSIGFRESFAITGVGGGSSSRVTVEAVDGNLLLFVSGVSVQDEVDLEKAVNAVISAAKH